MSKHKFAEVHCDIRFIIETMAEQEMFIPFEHKDFLQGPFLRMSDCLREGKRLGWKIKRIQGKMYDFCPACVQYLARGTL